jgi:hypothetical protein
MTSTLMGINSATTAEDTTLFIIHEYKNTDDLW